MGNPMGREREEGYWPGTNQGKAVRPPHSGNQTIPNGTVLSTPNGPGIGILNLTEETARPRVLTLGIPAGGAVAKANFPPAVFNGSAFASTSAGLVDSAGNAINNAGGLHPYLACVLEYGSGSARQVAWIDWYQGSYNLPSCEFVRVAALPWGTWWNLFPTNQFNAVASVSDGQIQGCHVPTITAVGDFAAGVLRSIATPANARAVEVLCTDPTVNTTITITGAAAGTRNTATGFMSPGWTPLEMDLGVQAIGITSSAAATLRVQFFLQL